MLAAQLMHQFTDLGRVVEVVAIVHHHRAGPLRQDERFECVQVTVAEKVVGEQFGAGNQQVLLGFLPSRLRCLRADA
jgi:hypothetical protein